MNFTREDHPQLGCDADVAASFDQLAQQANSVQQLPSAQPASSATSDLPASPEASSPPAEPPAQKRAPRSFRTPPRPGRGRLASREHAPVRNLGSHTEDTGRILLPIDLRDVLEEEAVLEYEARMAERAALSHAKMAAEEEKKRAARQTSEGKDGKELKEAKPSGEEAKHADKQVGKRASRSRRAADITSLVNPTCFCEQVAALPAIDPAL